MSHNENKTKLIPVHRDQMLRLLYMQTHCTCTSTIICPKHSPVLAMSAIVGGGLLLLVIFLSPPATLSAFPPSTARGWPSLMNRSANQPSLCSTFWRRRSIASRKEESHAIEGTVCILYNRHHNFERWFTIWHNG